MKYARSPIFLVLTVIMLPACDGGPRVAPPCPNIIVVQDTAEVTKFRHGPGRDLTDVVIDAKLERFSGFCETGYDDDVAEEVTVELKLFFTVTRGPANTDRRGRVDYFIAIADADERILAKQVFSTTVTFEGNRNRVVTFEELEQEIPLSVGQLGDDFSVFVGFQLNADELVYNRAKLLR
jgi:hypothetical protein